MTNELRELIRQELEKCTGWIAYYVRANEKAMYPHITFDLQSLSSTTDDVVRFDYQLTVDLWNKNDVVVIEDMADKVFTLFNRNNLPQSEILPTFIFDSRMTIIDEDKTINHRQLTFMVQTYERN